MPITLTDPELWSVLKARIVTERDDVAAKVVRGGNSTDTEKIAMNYARLTARIDALDWVLAEAHRMLNPEAVVDVAEELTE